MVVCVSGWDGREKRLENGRAIGKLGWLVKVWEYGSATDYI